ncbi:signal peptidase 22 kDa subunit [Backusella circina FSU 941]|nr:signal peptidase 22 kDa subunit [Backusella circina FSU 941]
MYNLQTRANAVLSFSITVLGTVLAVVALISAITGYGNILNRKLLVDEKNIKLVTRRYGTDGTDYRDSKSEFARLKFDIDADFTPVFNWNTKQVFVTVVADYQTDKFSRNTVVLWDKIITSKDKAHLKLRDVASKYALIDVNKRWNFDRANLTLLWDITPYVGILQSGESNNGAQFIIPPYAAKK